MLTSDAKWQVSSISLAWSRKASDGIASFT